MAKQGWPAATSFVTTRDRFARGALPALLTDELILEFEFFLADAMRLVPVNLSF
jgi:hypothetical protein